MMILVSIRMNYVCSYSSVMLLYQIVSRTAATTTGPNLGLSVSQDDVDNYLIEAVTVLNNLYDTSIQCKSIWRSQTQFIFPIRSFRHYCMLPSGGDGLFMSQGLQMGTSRYIGGSLPAERLQDECREQCSCCEDNSRHLRNMVKVQFIIIDDSIITISWRSRSYLATRILPQIRIMLTTRMWVILLLFIISSFL